MLLRMDGQSIIENPRNYSAGAVDELRGMLTSGAEARHDARRKYFYELENVNDVFYVHVSPISGNVVLLAKWSRQPQDTRIVAAQQSA